MTRHIQKLLRSWVNQLRSSVYQNICVILHVWLVCSLKGVQFCCLYHALAKGQSWYSALRGTTWPGFGQSNLMSNQVYYDGVIWCNTANIWLNDRQDCTCLWMNQQLGSRAAISQERQYAQWRKGEKEHQKIYPLQSQLGLFETHKHPAQKKNLSLARHLYWGFAKRATKCVKVKDIME